MIRLRLGAPEVGIDLCHLADYRRELGDGPFTDVLADIVDNPEAIISLLDQLDAKRDDTG